MLTAARAYPSRVCPNGLPHYGAGSLGELAERRRRHPPRRQGCRNKTPRDASHALVSTPSTEPAITAAANGITRRGTATANSASAISATIATSSTPRHIPKERQRQAVHGTATRLAIADQTAMGAAASNRIRQARPLIRGSSEEIRQRKDQ